MSATWRWLVRAVRCRRGCDRQRADQDTVYRASFVRPRSVRFLSGRCRRCGTIWSVRINQESPWFFDPWPIKHLL